MNWILPPDFDYLEQEARHAHGSDAERERQRLRKEDEEMDAAGDEEVEDADG